MAGIPDSFGSQWLRDYLLASVGDNPFFPIAKTSSLHMRQETQIRKFTEVSVWNNSVVTGASSFSWLPTPPQAALPRGKPERADRQ